MNQWFVNIKVDREERPDIDRIYMTATRMLTRHGGWPNSVFLTPELEPFYAGTYFPPEDRYGRPGFPSLLRTPPPPLARQQGTGRRNRGPGRRGDPGPPVRRSGPSARPGHHSRPRRGRCHSRPLRTAPTEVSAAPPSFRPSIDLEFLMHPWVAERRGKAASVVDHTLRAMADGGICDQVGGGFHRYATDARAGRVPHFEKMLYNQAQLARLYTRAYSLTGDERWRLVAEDILRFVDREMTSSEGPLLLRSRRRDRNRRGEVLHLDRGGDPRSPGAGAGASVLRDPRARADAGGT